MHIEEILRGDLFMKKNTLMLMLGALMLAPLSGCAEKTEVFEFWITQMNGVELEDVEITVKDSNGKVAAHLFTDNDGFTGKRLPVANYTLSFDGVPSNWTPSKTKIAKGETNIEVEFETSIINEAMPSNHAYKKGEVLYDFEVCVADAEGKASYQMASEYLKGHEVLAINLWATWCGWCEKEMPAMQEYYSTTTDKVEIVCLSCEKTDTLADAVDWRNKFGLTMPIGIDEAYQSQSTYKSSFSYGFGPEGIPATMVVDRYGIIQEMHEGAVQSSGQWARLFQDYLGDDYVPSKK